MLCCSVPNTTIDVFKSLFLFVYIFKHVLDVPDVLGGVDLLGLIDCCACTY